MSQAQRGQNKSGYLSEDTIAAITAPPGGAVSIIRVSGPLALTVLEKLSGQDIRSKQTPRKLFKSIIRDGDGTALDDALIAYFVAPASFTGEDCVEFNLHGSPLIATRVLEALQSHGVRQALAGEFSFRAVRNGKINLTQAQATADLIGASNDGAIALALEKMSGTQANLISSLADELRKLAVLGEIGIDFADQDVDEVSLPNLKLRVNGILKKLLHLKQSYSRGTMIQEGIKVAFVGLPNAGKSSFFNALLGEDRSIVSDIAGTTRDVVREKLTLQGYTSSVTLRLEDTAGLRNLRARAASESETSPGSVDNRPSYGSDHDTIEMIGIERTLKAAREADLILLLVDAQANQDAVTSLTEEWRRLGEPRDRTLGVITKMDLGMSEVLRDPATLAAFGLQMWQQTSAVCSDGISEAASAIADFCEKWVRREKGEVLLTRLDHLRSVEDAMDHLERGEQALEIDLFASDVRQALFALDPLIGETVPDDILGRIFSEFCIGK
ncbi:MAG: tRNA modification GTPase [Methylotenera sp.]|nr:tRNA modification GTPase [Oligoflexia bacterium]